VTAIGHRVRVGKRKDGWGTRYRSKRTRLQRLDRLLRGWQLACIRTIAPLRHGHVWRKPVPAGDSHRSYWYSQLYMHVLDVWWIHWLQVTSRLAAAAAAAYSWCHVIARSKPSVDAISQSRGRLSRSHVTLTSCRNVTQRNRTLTGQLKSRDIVRVLMWLRLVNVYNIYTHYIYHSTYGTPCTYVTRDASVSSLNASNVV